MSSRPSSSRNWLVSGRFGVRGLFSESVVVGEQDGEPVAVGLLGAPAFQPRQVVNEVQACRVECLVTAEAELLVGGAIGAGPRKVMYLNSMRLT